MNDVMIIGKIGDDMSYKNLSVAYKMVESTKVKCPICGELYVIYNAFYGNDSACSACIAKVRADGKKKRILKQLEFPIVDPNAPKPFSTLRSEKRLRKGDKSKKRKNER